MKMLNLKTVGNKLIAPFYKLYNIALNKVAIHSRIYKDLHNRFELDIELHDRIFEFVKIIETVKSIELITGLYQHTSPGVLRKFDHQVIRSSEPTDVIVVSSEIEKQEVLEIMKSTSGAGNVHTIDEFVTLLDKIPVHCSIYIFSSVWIKDQTKLVNLLYKINSNKEKYSL